MALVSKLPSAGVTIFTVMSTLANDTGAINLSQGFPDFDCAPSLIDAVAQKMREGHNQYCPMPGVLPLREALSHKIERLYGRRYDPATEITVLSMPTWQGPPSRIMSTRSPRPSRTCSAVVGDS